jgi:hypothetical protein
MHAAVHVYNITLPDTLFILNTEDASVCNEEQAIKGVRAKTPHWWCGVHTARAGADTVVCVLLAVLPLCVTHRRVPCACHQPLQGPRHGRPARAGDAAN